MTLRFDIKEYARRGAQARALELTAELREIYQLFPDMVRKRGGAASDLQISRRNARARRRRRRAPMSEAQKKAVSKRMKTYWAMRRAKK